jgi:MFS family permease
MNSSDTATSVGDASPPAAAVMSAAMRRRIVTAMLISTFMAAAEVTVISTAMPTIVARLGGFDLFTWAFGVYLLGQAVTTPIYGRLADLYGHRAVYLGSTALFLVGSLLCGLAWSMPALIVFRAIQGLGAGGLMPLATMIISDVAVPADRPRLLSYVTGIWGIAAILGPLIGSLCVSTVGWPFVFWINLPIGAITIALVMRNLKQPAGHRPPGRIDAIGSGLLAVGVGAAMAALIQWDMLAAETIALLCVAAVIALAGFAVRERRAEQPMLAAHLLRNPVIVAANVAGVLCGALVIEASAFIPAWVQGVPGRSALAAGFAMGLLTLSWTATGMSLGQVLGRLSIRTVAFVAALAMVLGSAGLLGLPRWGWPMLLAASVPLGAGLGATSLVFTVAVQAAAARDDRGRATSLYYFSRLIGQAVGAAAFGGVMNASLSAGGPAMHGALRALMDPASRRLLPAADLARLVPALDGALFRVFAFGLVIAVFCVPVAWIVPGRRAGQPM